MRAKNILVQFVLVNIAAKKGLLRGKLILEDTN